MNICLRKEEPKDFRRVEELARDAFWNLYFPGAHEHYVVHVMRDHKDHIAELTYVIEVDGEVQGAIFYTHSKVLLPHGEELATISFGPVLIAPAFHRQGLGRKLIEYTIALAKEQGHKAILTLGYPYHYAPYGFVGAKKYGVAMPDGKFYTGLLALPLQEDGLAMCQHAQTSACMPCTAVFSDVFEVNPEDVEAFDTTFPPKEKGYQESQKEFEASCTKLDEE